MDNSNSIYYEHIIFILWIGIILWFYSLKYHTLCSLVRSDVNPTKNVRLYNIRYANGERNANLYSSAWTVYNIIAYMYLPLSTETYNTYMYNHRVSSASTTLYSVYLPSLLAVRYSLKDSVVARIRYARTQSCIPSIATLVHTSIYTSYIRVKRIMW